MFAFIAGTGISVLCYMIVKPDSVIFNRIYGYQTKFPLIFNCLCDEIEVAKAFLSWKDILVIIFHHNCAWKIAIVLVLSKLFIISIL